MSMKAAIYLVRHGETVWNRVGRLQGQADAPLTLLGIRQAQAIGRTLAGRLGDAPFTLHASPIGRARQTAAVIAELTDHDYFAIRWDDRLKEITLGARDGYAGWRQLARDFPEEAAQRAADPWNFRHPGGESSQMVQDRVRPALDEWRAAGGRHVVVAHGVVNKILRGLYLGLSRAQTYALDRPQDIIHHFRDGQITDIPAEGLER